MLKCFKYLVFFLIIFFMVLVPGFAQDTTKFISIGNTNYIAPVKEYTENFFKPIQIVSNDISIILILLVVINSILIFNYGSLISVYFESIYKITKFNYLYDTRNSLINNSLFILSNFYLINIGILLWLFIIFKPIDLHTNKSLVLLSLIFGLIFWRHIKILIMKIFSLLFGREDISDLIIFIRKINDSSFSVILPFFIFLIPYLHKFSISLIYFTFLILLLNFFLKTLRSFTIFLKKEFSLFIVIFYLCTIEILPFFIFILLINNKLDLKFI